MQFLTGNIYCSFHHKKRKKMFKNPKIHPDRLYLILSGIFIAALVASNLIFQKFFLWTVWLPLIGNYTFEISVGILPYPVTFLVTDIVSEIYGRKKADQIVVSGFVASMFIMGVVLLADYTTATSWSPVGGEMFHTVFGLFGPAIFASMVAYLAAQFIDIRIFHFWKKLTHGRHLWIRNNGSTIVSQLVDTSAVLLLLCVFGVIGWERFPALLLNGFFFKVIVALTDTPFFYLCTYGLRKHFGLAPGEELNS